MDGHGRTWTGGECVVRSAKLPDSPIFQFSNSLYHLIDDQFEEARDV